ncbi:MAG: hypothetical protein DMG49_24525 [Acidobacteria bacterium]|nr:MAG: hypothetical protein DMG49_24525 [Acidobacteriota bacterium]
MDAALLEFWCSVHKFASAMLSSYLLPSGSHLETSVSAQKNMRLQFRSFPQRIDLEETSHEALEGIVGSDPDFGLR